MTDEEFKAKLKEMLINNLTVEIKIDNEGGCNYNERTINFTVDVEFDDEHVYRAWDCFTIKEAD